MSDRRHLCLACNTRIKEGQAETQVNLTRGGKKGTVRFRHTNDADCREGLR